jgi:hypothetical protein
MRVFVDSLRPTLESRLIGILDKPTEGEDRPVYMSGQQSLTIC